MKRIQNVCSGPTVSQTDAFALGSLPSVLLFSAFLLGSLPSVLLFSRLSKISTS